MKKRRILAAAIGLGFLTSSFSSLPGSQQTDGKQQNTETGAEKKPDLPALEKNEQNSFDRMTEKVLHTSGISVPSFDLLITPTSTEPSDDVFTAFGSPIDLKFSNLLVDLSEANVLNLNFSTSLEVSYKTVVRDLHLSFESDKDDGKAYIQYQSKSYLLSCGTTLSDLFTLLKALNISTPGDTDGLKSVDISSLLTNAKQALSTAYSTASQNVGGGFDYSLDFTPVSVEKDTTISDISLLLSTDGEDNLSGFKTKKPIYVSSGFTLAFDGTGSFQDKSTYTKTDSSSYTDITHGADSILTTLAKIVDDKTMNLKIDGTLVDPKKNESTISGVVEGDVSTVDSDLSKGRYTVDLTHHGLADNSGDENISLFYDGSNEKAYLNLNDSFKGMIANASIKDVFSSVSDATDKSSYKGFTDAMKDILKDCDFTKLLNGDTSGFGNLVKDYDYVRNATEEYFYITLSATAFGLGDYDITLKANFSGDKLSSLSLSNIQYQDYALKNVTLTLQEFVPIAFDTTGYKSYSEGSKLFSNIAKLVKDKKVSATYTLDYNDPDGDNKYHYVANGNIDADLSSVTSFDNLAEQAKNGDYHISLTTTNSSCTNALAVHYTGKTLYVDYNNGGTESVFKNSISDTVMDSTGTSIDKVVDKYSTASSKSLSGMSGVIDAVKNSSILKDDIEKLKQGYISGLTSFLSIDKDNTDASTIKVVLDINKVLEKDSLKNYVSAITLKLNADDLNYKEITASCTIDGSALTFSLVLDTYNDSYKLTDTEKALYLPINFADKLMDSFYNLPSFGKDKYGIGISASVSTKTESAYNTSKSATTVSPLSISGEARVNAASFNNSDVLTKNTDGNVTSVRLPSMDGTMVLTAPSLNDKNDTKTATVNHTVGFTYTYNTANPEQSQLYAQYNSKMHLKMQSHTLTEIYTKVKDVSTSDTNLLHRYLKGLSNTATGVPVTDAFKTKNASLLLDYPYIKKVEINDSSVVLKVDAKLLDSTDTTGNIDTLTVSFDNVNAKIQSISIDGTSTSDTTESDGTTKNKSTKSISASISLKDYGDVADPTVATSGVTFIDLDSFSTLVDCLVDTTESNYFHITGSFTINIKVLSIFTLKDTTINVDARIYVKDEHVYAYLLFNNSNSIYTEIFISEKEVLMARTKSSQTEYFKTTQENVLENVAYYIFTYIVDIDSMTGGGIAAANIYNGVNSSGSSSGDSGATMNDDLSGLINSAVLNGKFFDLDVNLSNFITVSGVSFPSSLKVHVGYTDNGNGYTPLTYVTIDKTSLTAYSVVTVNLNGSAALEDIKTSSVNITSDTAFGSSSYMKRYHDFVTQFQSDYGDFDATSTLPYYIISGYKIKTTWIIFKGDVITSYTIQDNASEAKKYASSGSVYYYQH